MGTKVYKYELSSGAQIVWMPGRAKILCAQLQNEKVCIWAQVNPEIGIEPRTFVIVGTGHEIPKDTLQYISTVQIGPLVFHVFEDA